MVLVSSMALRGRVANITYPLCFPRIIIGTNVRSNIASYRTYSTRRSGTITNPRNHRCRSKFVVNSLILYNSWNLWSVIVMMIFVHLLFKLFDMLI